MVGLKDFTRQDWDAFSGCDSDNPRIGEDVTVEIGGVVHESVLILDGSCVQIYPDDIIVFFKEFADDAYALDWVDTSKASLTEESLISSGFRKM